MSPHISALKGIITYRSGPGNLTDPATRDTMRLALRYRPNGPYRPRFGTQEMKMRIEWVRLIRFLPEMVGERARLGRLARAVGAITPGEDESA